MPESVAFLREAVDSQGNGLRVEFTKPADRFGHTVLGVRGGEVVPILCSIEGTPEDFAPPSPPLTELHQQPSLTFLTGATSIAHWSMSVEVVEGGIWFDVACRAKRQPPVLGSAYQVVEKQFELEVGATCCVNQSGNLLNILPAAEASNMEEFPTTFRWRYRISLILLHSETLSVSSRD
ncbi:MAG: hypothetical protein ACR2NM_17715 [Bythopirellula sp.]